VVFYGDGDGPSDSSTCSSIRGTA